MADHFTISSLCEEGAIQEDLHGSVQDALQLHYKHELQKGASSFSSIPGSGNNLQKGKDLLATSKTSVTKPQRKKRPPLKDSPPLKSLSDAIRETQGKKNENVPSFSEMEEKILSSVKKDLAKNIGSEDRQPMEVSATLNQESEDMASKTVNWTMQELKETRMELMDEVFDNKVEKDDVKVFLVFAGRNPLATLSLDTSSDGLVDSGMVDPMEHIPYDNIVKLQGSHRAAYHMTRYSMMGKSKFLTFLAFLNPSGIRGLPPVVMRNENIAVLRLNDGGEKEEFRDRPPESLPYQIFPPELMDKMRNPLLLPRLIFKIAMDSIAEEVALCSFNQENAVKALLLKKVLAAKFKNDRAAHLFEKAAAALCRGKAPISFCRLAGLELLNQILGHWNEVRGKQINISDFAASNLKEGISSLVRDVLDLRTETNSFESVLSEYEGREESKRCKYFESMFSTMEKRGDGQDSDILNVIDDAYGTPRVQPNDDKTVTVYDKVNEQVSVVDEVDDETSSDEESDWSVSYIKESLKDHERSNAELSYYRKKRVNDDYDSEEI